MAKYSDLHVGNFYLIQQNEGEEISLIEVLMSTDNALMFLHHDEYESLIWKKGSDTIFEIVDELTDEQLKTYNELFEEEEDQDDLLNEKNMYDEMFEDDDINEETED